ncbi:NAD-dependent epimerase/dehydratase family protein [Endozoicomonas sp. 2B-B]
MSYKIVVTGGAGYIGSILVPELLVKGYEVTVLDNFMYKQSSLNHCAYHRHFTVIKGDIRNKSIVATLLKSADIVIPLAALVGAPLCNFDPISATSTNYDAIKMMLKLLSKDQLVLMPTTNSAYGTSEPNCYFDEQSPLNPISQYAREKAEIEKYLMDHSNAISFRLATVFGMSPRMRIDLLVNDFTYRAVYDRFQVLFESNFKRNYIHVRDVSRVFQHGIDNHAIMRGEIYNVGLSDANLSKKELCEHIKRQIPDFVYFEEKIRKDPDQRNYIVSNKKIEATKYKTSFTIDDGIRELIKGYKMISNSRYQNL